MPWDDTARKQHSRDGLRYPSDLTDREWCLIEPLLPPARRGGRPRTTDLRAVTEAVLYIASSGCQWRMLPKDFPPVSTVRGYFYAWRDAGLWQTINHLLVMSTRELEGREASPRAGVIDSQSVKTTESGGVCGYDAGKKINGRKRHILVDTLGLLLVVLVTAASVQDRDGARQLLRHLPGPCKKLRKIWVDGAYSGRLVDWVAERFRFVLAVVLRPKESRRFVLLPRRWVVERTFGWLNLSRRLSKDYERLMPTSETWIYLAMIRLMAHRLA